MYINYSCNKLNRKTTKKDLTVLPSTQFHQQRKVPHLCHSDQDEEQSHSTDLGKPKNTSRDCAISPQSPIFP